MFTHRHLLVAAAIPLAALLAGCGGSGSALSSLPTVSSATQTTAASSSAPSSSDGGKSGGAGALVAEAQSAAAGDIPDNQVFLTYRAPAAAGGYSMNYPEGWATKGTGIEELIQDKNNLVRILVEPGSPTMSQVQQDVAKLKTSAAGITVSAPIPHPTCTNMGKTVNLPLAVAEVNYTTQSKADPVTGKQVTLLVDRYYTKDGSKLAVIDMGTPKGVDNVDAYCLMISSFR